VVLLNWLLNADVGNDTEGGMDILLPLSI